ncbi:MAG TPA: hypothetical protein VN618_04785 [Solirubrobacteraceae bacterium]|nr:hypothetical protein [Solirubrobacteraceae bacterium]
MSPPAPGNPTQRLVRETMLAAGGYWRPLAAVARLLEELGEISELLASDSPAAELAGELADVWIITAALADQFLADVAEPGAGESTPAGGPGALVQAAGPIARVVNHYDGPKVPRAGAELPSLAEAVASFHAVLGGLATEHGIELRSAVREKVDRIHARGDIERFGRDGFDPSTAPLLGALAEAVETGVLPSRLWAGPDLGAAAASAEARGEAARETLTMFAKAARAERLQGYLVAGPEPAARSGEAAWLGALVESLDPAGSVRSFELGGEPLSASAVVLPGDARVYALFTAP